MDFSFHNVFKHKHLVKRFLESKPCYHLSGHSLDPFGGFIYRQLLVALDGTLHICKDEGKGVSVLLFSLFLFLQVGFPSLLHLDEFLDSDACIVDLGLYYQLFFGQMGHPRLHDPLVHL